MRRLFSLVAYGGEAAPAADDEDLVDSSIPHERTADSGAAVHARSELVSDALSRATTEHTAAEVLVAATSGMRDDESLPEVLDRIIALGAERVEGDAEISDEIRLRLQHAYARCPLAEAKLLEKLLVEVPQDHICCITYNVMCDPVVCSDGHTYERAAITKWCERGNKNSPMTRVELETISETYCPYNSMVKMVPNIALRGAIVQWRERRGLAPLELPTPTPPSDAVVRLHASMSVDQGTAAMEHKKYATAALHFRKGLELREQVLGPTDALTLSAAQQLASALSLHGKLEEAEVMHRRVLDGSAMELGENDPDTLAAAVYLATILIQRRKYGEAEVLHRRVMEERGSALGLMHTATLLAAEHLAACLKTQGKYGEAEVLALRVVAGREMAYGAMHERTLRSVDKLADILQTEGKFVKARAMYQRLLEGRDATLGPTNEITLHAVVKMAALLKNQNKNEEAEPLLRRAMEGWVEMKGEAHARTQVCISALAEVMERQGKLEESRLLRVRVFHPRLLAQRAAALLIRGAVPVPAVVQEGGGRERWYRRGKAKGRW